MVLICKFRLLVLNRWMFRCSQCWFWYLHCWFWYVYCWFCPGIIRSPSLDWVPFKCFFMFVTQRLPSLKLSSITQPVSAAVKQQENFSKVNFYRLHPCTFARIFLKKLTKYYSFPKKIDVARKLMLGVYSYVREAAQFFLSDNSLNFGVIYLKVITWFRVAKINSWKNCIWNLNVPNAYR